MAAVADYLVEALGLDTAVVPVAVPSRFPSLRQQCRRAHPHIRFIHHYPASDLTYSLWTTTWQALNLIRVDAEQLGLRIRQLRKAHGWTQEALAEKAGIHPVYLAGIEGGKRNPSFKNLARIAAALEIALSKLFAEDDTAQ